MLRKVSSTKATCIKTGFSCHEQPAIDIDIEWPAFAKHHF
jgi:hypothetical protein